MKRTALALALLSTALYGCRGDDDGGGADGGNNGDGGAGGDTIYDIQSDSMPVGTPVELRGVVVTAVDTFGGRTGGVYVQEPMGGEFSGVFVFLQGTQAAGLAAGDLVDVLGGVKDEFALQEDDTGRTLTEVSPPQGGQITITKVGDGTLPTPPVVLPQDLAADDAEAEKWEGVPVTFENARVFNVPAGVSSSDPTLKEMSVTGPFQVSSGLTDLPDTILESTCYSSITGIGDYFFTYKILPRSTADLTVGADTDCLPVEETAALCGDTMDNDFNGFSDCQDRGCQNSPDQAVADACTSDVSVTDIQDGTFDPASGKVRITGAVVTGVAFNGRNFWIQDSTGAAQFNGVFAFQPSSAMRLSDQFPGAGIGSTMDIEASVVEFQGITELSFIEMTNVTAAGTATPAVLAGPAPAVLADVVTAEPYEGVLVSLDNVEVVDPDIDVNGMTGIKFSIGVAGTELIADDEVFRYPMNVGGLVAGQCLSNVTGVMHFNTFDDHTSINPRDAADVDATVGVCN